MPRGRERESGAFARSRGCGGGESPDRRRIAALLSISGSISYWTRPGRGRLQSAIYTHGIATSTVKARLYPELLPGTLFVLGSKHSRLNSLHTRFLASHTSSDCFSG